MFEDDGRERLAEEWSDFNQSLLFFLPKKATGTTASGEGIYEPENVRPLNVTIAENRILANAMRLVIERVVGRHVIWTHRSFIKGRSMIAI